MMKTQQRQRQRVNCKIKDCIFLASNYSFILFWFSFYQTEMAVTTVLVPVHTSSVATADAAKRDNNNNALSMPAKCF